MSTTSRQTTTSPARLRARRAAASARWAGLERRVLRGRPVAVPDRAAARGADPLESAVTEGLRTRGYHLLHVGEGCACEGCTSSPLPPERMFAYTVGLSAVGHPEVVLRGRRTEEAAPLLGWIAEYVLGGAVLRPGESIGTAAESFELSEVAAPGRELVYAEVFRGPRALRALELVPDPPR